MLSSLCTPCVYPISGGVFAAATLSWFQIISSFTLVSNIGQAMCALLLVSSCSRRGSRCHEDRDDDGEAEQSRLCSSCRISLLQQGKGGRSHHETDDLGEKSRRTIMMQDQWHAMFCSALSSPALPSFLFLALPHG